jgi:hypothetical protein
MSKTCLSAKKPCTLKKKEKNRCILNFFCGIIIERFSKGEKSDLKKVLFFCYFFSFQIITHHLIVKCHI